MKKLLIVLTVLVVAALFYRQYRELRNYKDTAQLQAVELSTLKDNVSVLKKKNGEMAFQIESVEVEKRNLKESLELLGIEKKDLKEQNIRQRNLIGVLQLEIESFGSGQTTVIDTFKIVETDTVRYQKVNDYTDPYLSLFNGEIINGDFDFDYRQNVHMRLFHHTKKDAIIVTANIKNPSAEIVSGQSLTISTKKRWYQKPWVWAAAGLTTGIIISK